MLNIYRFITRTAVAQAVCICENRGSIYSFIILDDVALGDIQTDIYIYIYIYINIITVIPIPSIPYLPEIKTIEYNSISIPYSRFLNKHLI